MNIIYKFLMSKANSSKLNIFSKGDNSSHRLGELHFNSYTASQGNGMILFTHDGTASNRSLDFRVDNTSKIKLDNTKIEINTHILPSTNAAYDLGSAEYKIRHLFLSDNSLWIGDTHKISITEGQMKFRKRKTNVMPKSIQNTFPGGDDEAKRIAAEQHREAWAAGNASGVTLQNMKLNHWEAYAKTIDGINSKGVGLAEVNDIFRTNEIDDYDEQFGSNSWIETGANIHTLVTNVGIGVNNPKTKLEVDGTITTKKYRQKFIVKAAGGKYHINGRVNPVLNLQRGKEYEFDLSDASTNNHPFYITTSSNGGNDVSTGAAAKKYNTQDGLNMVTSNGNHYGTTNKSVIFAVPDNAPGSLYYQCGNHQNMGNKLNIDGTILSDSLNKTSVTVSNENVIKFNTDNIERIRIKGDGKVGIGIESPDHILQFSTTHQSKICLYGNSTHMNGFGTSNYQLNYHVSSTLDRHVFYAEGTNGNGTELMRIQGNGNVGIGNGNPGTKLQISSSEPYLTLKNSTNENTDGGCESKIIFEDHDNNTLGQIQCSHDGTADDTKGDLIFSTSNGVVINEAMRIDSSGTVIVKNINDTKIQLTNASNTNSNFIKTQHGSTTIPLTTLGGGSANFTNSSGSISATETVDGTITFTNNNSAWGSGWRKTEAVSATIGLELSYVWHTNSSTLASQYYIGFSSSNIWGDGGDWGSQEFSIIPYVVNTTFRIFEGTSPRGTDINYTATSTVKFRIVLIDAGGGKVKAQYYYSVDEGTETLLDIGATEVSIGTGLYVKYGGGSASGTTVISDFKVVSHINAIDFYVCDGTPNNTSNTGIINNLSLYNGNVGIGITTPVTKLHVVGDLKTTGSYISTGTTSGTSTSGGNFYVSSQGSYTPGHIILSKWVGDDSYGVRLRVEGGTPHFYIEQRTNGSLLATWRFITSHNSVGKSFTGQHMSIINNYSNETLSSMQGLIVCSDKNSYTLIDPEVRKGNKAIDINDAIPDVSLCTKEQDKSVFGVISNTEDDADNRSSKTCCVVKTEHYKESGDTRTYINSLGEGAIWVSDKNGNLESGDYITSCTIPGYGMKQNSDSLKNYTVAKITMDCDFNPVTQPVPQILKDSDGKNILDSNKFLQWENHATETEKAYNIRHLLADGTQITETDYNTRNSNGETVYKAAFVGCSYHCG